MRANLGAMSLIGGWFGIQFIATLYMQSLRGWSALETGLAIFPGGLLVALIAPRLQPLIERFGVSRLIVAGLASTVAAYALFLPIGLHSHYAPDLLPTFVLGGLGFALAYGPLNIAATTGVAPHEQGLAGGLVNTSFQFGGALVLAVATAVNNANASPGDGAGRARRLPRGDLRLARRRRPRGRGHGAARPRRPPRPGASVVPRRRSAEFPRWASPCCAAKIRCTARRARMRKIIVMGAGGRDFHNYNVAFRDDPGVQVVGFTAAQIPGIADRVYPRSLAGERYPDGIPIWPEDELTDLIHEHGVDEVVLAYSDLAHETVMHKASIVLAAGADFRLLGPDQTMLHSTKPVVAVCAVRTGCGKSQTTRRIGQILLDAGLRVALVRHPMPYGDLEAMRVQRFATLDDIDASHPTVEEREEYEEPVRMGMVMYAGVDYEEILHEAEEEADVIVWDGGNNDFPFFAPELMITVVDPLRPGHELRYHPGEVNLRMADVVVINKVDSAEAMKVEEVLASVRSVNPLAEVVFAKSPPRLDPGPDLLGRRVLVVDDGPTLTHGGMPFGAGLVAARGAGAGEIVDPRPFAVGSLARTLRRWPQLTNVLPAMGYGDEQLADLERTINATDCDVVVTGTPIDLGRLIRSRHPIRHVRYDLEEIGAPTLDDVLAPILVRTGRLSPV